MLLEMLNTRIDIRLNSNTLLLFKNISKNKENKIPSQKCRELILNYINNGKKYIDKADKQILKELKQAEYTQKLKDQIRKDNYYGYLFSNTLNTLYNMQISIMTITGSPNMIYVCKVIDSARKLFNTFPKNIKSELRADMYELEKLKLPDVFRDKIRVMSFIKAKKKVKKIEGKFIGK